MAMSRALLAWSTGKDSAYSLALCRSGGFAPRRGDPDEPPPPCVEIVGLLTTVTATYDRASMHGVRRSLLRRQAAATGLPCLEIEIPTPCSNDVYEAAMAAALTRARAEGITHVVFGDLFLADLRAWREERLATVGMTGVFPLWQRDTAALARTMIDE